MNEERAQNLLIIGLVAAGKSSYIHAVDDLLQNPPSEDALRSYGLAKDRSYLERHKSKFRAGKPIGRTERDPQGAPPELLFEHSRTGKRGRLFLPDMDGEIFQDQWVGREWEQSYREDLKRISGALLFVRADVPASNQELLGSMIQKKGQPRETVPWDPKKASQQVQLVDVMQFIAASGLTPRPLRVAVMISAWDTVEKQGNLQPKNPDAFLKREWAMLDQYLHTNEDFFTYKAYGVSALGGGESEMEELSCLAPQDRVKLVQGNHSSKDLTIPLRWLLQLD